MSRRLILLIAAYGQLPVQRMHAVTSSRNIDDV